MKACNAKYANMEVGARINILDKYFPAAELGIGDCKRESAETGNTFSATAPYMRFGLDYNFNKKHNGNRLFGIFRYGFCSYKYDIGNPSFEDKPYGTAIALDMSGQKATAHWLEFGIGLETKLWSFIRLGWSIRYKFRAALSHPEEGKPYYIPGFGKNDSNGWGGTVNLVFDVGKTKNFAGSRRACRTAAPHSQSGEGWQRELHIQRGHHLRHALSRKIPLRQRLEGRD